MEKKIGFRRNIYLHWMDAAAAYSAETADPVELRARLDPIVGEQIKSAENRAAAITILLNIWAASAEAHPRLQADAVTLFARTTEVADRLWLHYGMTLLAYDFFRLGVIAVGQLSRYDDVITPKAVKRKLTAELGQLGGLEKATERVIFSLRNWGVLVESEQRYAYRPQRRHFSASSVDLEAWMLAAALTAHPAEELPFADLTRLPELFPFRFTLIVDDLRRSDRFRVHRQGLGWDMVRLATVI
jgi:hypothetical protein